MRSRVFWLSGAFNGSPATNLPSLGIKPRGSLWPLRQDGSAFRCASPERRWFDTEPCGKFSVGSWHRAIAVAGDIGSGNPETHRIDVETVEELTTRLGSHQFGYSSTIDLPRAGTRA